MELKSVKEIGIKNPGCKTCDYQCFDNVDVFSERYCACEDNMELIHNYYSGLGLRHRDCRELNRGGVCEHWVSRKPWYKRLRYLFLWRK